MNDWLLRDRLDDREWFFVRVPISDYDFRSPSLFGPFCSIEIAQVFYEKATNILLESLTEILNLMHEAVSDQREIEHQAVDGQ